MSDTGLKLLLLTLGIVTDQGIVFHSEGIKMRSFPEYDEFCFFIELLASSTYGHPPDGSGR